MERDEITYRDRIEQVRLLATAYGWREVSSDHERGRLGYRRKGMKLDIWYNRPTGFTVSSALKHPKLGTTQMIRKRVSIPLLEMIFENPRVHTPLGYIKKKRTNISRWRTSV